MLMTMASTGLLVAVLDPGGEPATLEASGSEHTFALSFHVIPALSQSALVSGWLGVVTSDTG
jgi:hypothetical protein